MSKGFKRIFQRNAGVKSYDVVLPVRNVTLAVTNGAPGYGTVVVGGLPQGNILFMGAVAYLQFTTADADVTATFDGDYSLGTGPTADGSLSGSEVDIIPSTALGAATAKVSPNVRGVSAVATSGTIFDNTDGTLEVNLNLLIDDAAISGNADFTVEGAVYLSYKVMGDD